MVLDHRSAAVEELVERFGIRHVGARGEHGHEETTVGTSPHASWRDSAEVERARLRQHLGLERFQCGSGLETELRAQMRSGALIGGQGLGLAPAPVEREHELHHEALARGVAGDQSLELADQRLMPAGRELGVDPQLEC